MTGESLAPGAGGDAKSCSGAHREDAMLEPYPETAKTEWGFLPATTIGEVARVCCGWHYKVASIPDPSLYDDRVERIHRAVNARDPAFPLIEGLVSETLPDRLYPEIVPLFRPREVYPGMRLYFPDTCPSFSLHHFPEPPVSPEAPVVPTASAAAETPVVTLPVPAEPPPLTPDELDSRERATLLIIIGALARHARIDLTEPTKAAGIIAVEARTLGVRLGARTIQTHLKRVADAIAQRTNAQKPLS
jgi:hypothetical protein